MRTLLLVTLIACTTHEATLGEQATEVCGPAPLAPGWAASFETRDGRELATMIRADYLAIVRWRDDVESWRDCVLSL